MIQHTTFSVLRAHFAHKRGMWPVSGGSLAQSFSFTEAQGHLATIEGNYRKLDGAGSKEPQGREEDD